jgi:hypothetical protein
LDTGGELSHDALRGSGRLCSREGGLESRVNFLKLPRAGRDDYVINAAALNAVSNGAFSQHRRE